MFSVRVGPLPAVSGGKALGPTRVAFVCPVPLSTHTYKGLTLLVSRRCFVLNSRYINGIETQSLALPLKFRL